MYTQVKSKETK